MQEKAKLEHRTYNVRDCDIGSCGSCSAENACLVPQLGWPKNFARAEQQHFPTHIVMVDNHVHCRQYRVQRAPIAQLGTTLVVKADSGELLYASYSKARDLSCRKTQNQIEEYNEFS